MKRSFLLLLLVIALGARADIPAGYYDDAIGKKDAELKSVMSRIILPHTRIDYGAKGTWVVFRSSDVRPDGSIWDMYSDVVRYFPETGSHPEMHIEHSVPKSWWGEESTFVYEASYDLHHLVPSDASTNMSKSNNILGEVTTPTFDNGVSKIGKAVVNDKELSVFEPADEYKGDFARMYMYVVTCYQDYKWESDGVYMFNTEAYPTLNDYAQDLLLSWHRKDPVSDKEIERNEAVFAAQYNRNPYIDFPSLAEYIWGDSVGHVFNAQLDEKPYLLTPVAGEKIDMGAVMSGSTLNYDLYIEGRFISHPLTLGWKQNKGIKLSAGTLSPDDVIAGTTVNLCYTSDEQVDILRDTLVISGGGLSPRIEIPVELRGTTTFIPMSPIDVTSTSAVLRWVAVPQALSYTVELYEGASEATDLFISAYVEGSSYNKAIALYNGTKRTVMLSDYALGRQHNGVGELVDYRVLPDETIAPGETYVIVNSQCSDETLRSYAHYFMPSGEESPLNFNGNDAVALYHNNIVIDMVGVMNDISNWGKDVTLYRSPATLGPTVRYNASQWSVATKDHCAGLLSHEMSGLVDTPLLVTSVDTDATAVSVQGLLPDAVYVYKVEATLPQGVQEGLYATVFTTMPLPAPEGLHAEQVHAEGFELHWNEVDDAEGYEVECYTLEGVGSVTVAESFDSVTSDGTPLPYGWTGTASGNYTSAASSGISAPSVALKNSSEYIETPTYDAAITEMSFLYRFASKATGSTLHVEKLANGYWSTLQTIEYVNTTKATQRYTFEREEDVRAFRFTYNKVSGNMAIDDVTITYGTLDTVYAVKNEWVESPMYVAYPLTSPETYYCRVRSVLGDVRSEWSAVGAVTTDPNITDVTTTTNRSIICTTDGGDIVIHNLPHNSYLVVYDMQGCVRHSSITTSSHERVIIAQKGIYLIKIVNGENNFAIKIAL